MKLTATLLLVVYFLVSTTHARYLLGPELVIFKSTIYLDEQGHLVAYCDYKDGDKFSKRVEYGQSLAKQELNGRCIKCWECKDYGMQCERTATGTSC
ncbi:hypothetical protein NP493_1230g00015 [Ridgeia piscesae]|uniref:Uncharacterized protein n=1 Tax=Ridgeia piscesae TaxID=27915 RepID=A0AAD9NFT6_RIDPI|nr:hypothetical protein NP493_1230g00015 [Ridgeia piscesae]